MSEMEGDRAASADYPEPLESGTGSELTVAVNGLDLESVSFKPPSNDENEEAEVAALRERLRQKEALLADYSEALKKKPSPDHKELRSTYTTRISDYLRSVDKQAQETDRILDSVTRAQKDLNLLEGKLDRTYGEVEATVFQIARRDSSLVSSYKLLSELHTTCALIVATESKCGKIKRETRAARDRVESESAAKRREVINLQDIEADLSKLRKENQDLKNRLESMREKKKSSSNAK